MMIDENIHPGIAQFIEQSSYFPGHHDAKVRRRHLVTLDLVRGRAICLQRIDLMHHELMTEEIEVDPSC